MTDLVKDMTLDNFKINSISSVLKLSIKLVYFIKIASKSVTSILKIILKTKHT